MGLVDIYLYDCIVLVYIQENELYSYGRASTFPRYQ